MDYSIILYNEYSKQGSSTSDQPQKYRAFARIDSTQGTGICSLNGTTNLTSESQLPFNLSLSFNEVNDYIPNHVKFNLYMNVTTSLVFDPFVEDHTWASEHTESNMDEAGTYLLASYEWDVLRLSLTTIPQNQILNIVSSQYFKIGYTKDGTLCAMGATSISDQDDFSKWVAVPGFANTKPDLVYTLKTQKPVADATFEPTIISYDSVTNTGLFISVDNTSWKLIRKSIQLYPPQRTTIIPYSYVSFTTTYNTDGVSLEYIMDSAPTLPVIEATEQARKLYEAFQQSKYMKLIIEGGSDYVKR